jgi:alkylated DNA repair dioxygenase AlkB
MQLFNRNFTDNLLPFDGELYYYGPVFTSEEVANWYQLLLHQIPWEHDELIMFGKKIITARKVAWYGDNHFSYVYSHKLKLVSIWTTELLNLKNQIEKKCGETFNSCLLNLYHHGKESMGWHSDNERELVPNGTIASVSFGAERKFMFRHNEKKNNLTLMLESGSILLMKGSIQTHWKHQLPAMAKITTPRINLTFRNMIQ